MLKIYTKYDLVNSQAFLNYLNFFLNMIIFIDKKIIPKMSKW